MATRSVFARKQMLFAVVAAAFAAGSMTACKSNEATYRPAPKTTTTAPAYNAPTYTAPTYTAPPPAAPKPAGGTAACGKGGKCG